MSPPSPRPRRPSRRRGKGSIVGNVLNSRGDAPAVEVLAAQCLFNDNRVDARLNGKIAVTLAAPVVIVSTNRVTGNEFSIQITARPPSRPQCWATSRPEAYLSPARA